MEYPDIHFWLVRQLSHGYFICLYFVFYRPNGIATLSFSVGVDISSWLFHGNGKIDRKLLLRIMPNQLFTEATTTLLMPSVRSLGPLTMEQVYGTIPGPLPLGQSVLLVWPQVTGLIAATVICFALSYLSFMRREIRSR